MDENLPVRVDCVRNEFTRIRQRKEKSFWCMIRYIQVVVLHDWTDNHRRDLCRRKREKVRDAHIQEQRYRLPGVRGEVTGSQ